MPGSPAVSLVGSPWPEGFARGRANRRALLALASLRGLAPARLLDLALRKGSAVACLAEVRAGRAGSGSDQGYARTLDVTALERALGACGARFVAPGDEEYVDGLSDGRDPPPALFVRGRSLAELHPRVAIVGARNASPVGRGVARGIGRELGAAGVCVVSGGARGIDAESHRGALEWGGTSIAVMGCGIDRVYPAGSRRLIEQVEGAGAIVSEYPPGVEPEPFRFPARNRIVAALASAVVVVEGRIDSGSLITADHALDIGRTVFAVPGAVNNPLADAPLALIREGAPMIRGADDLLEELGLVSRRSPERAGTRVAGDREATHARSPDLSDMESQVYGAIEGPSLPDVLARRTGLVLTEILQTLTSLELRGLVRMTGGRVDRRVS